MIRLVNVYALDPTVETFLFDLMAERLDEGDKNISHVKMPTLGEHRMFIASQRYWAWYAIQRQDGRLVGSVNMTTNNELGIVIGKSHRRQGYAREALIEIMRRHPPLPAIPSVRAGTYLANIRDGNHASIALFESLGAKILQHTYTL